MTPIKVIDEVTFKQDMKNLYNTQGYDVSLQVLYEFITAANILAEVLVEERKKL